MEAGLASLARQPGKWDELLLCLYEKQLLNDKNDMFYVHRKFRRNRMKIKEVEAYWRFCMHF
jgi:hypothetical protein